MLLFSDCVVEQKWKRTFMYTPDVRSFIGSISSSLAPVNRVGGVGCRTGQWPGHPSKVTNGGRHQIDNYYFKTAVDRAMKVS